MRRRCLPFIGAACLIVQLAATACAADDWPTLQGNAQRTGFIQETIEPPYRVLWEVPLPGRLAGYTQPIVTGGRVYLATLNGAVFALDAATGRKLWTFRGGGPFLHSVAVADGRVLAPSHDGIVYAISAQDGKELWRFKAGGSFWASPCCADGKVFVGCDDGTFYALDQASGKLAWSHPVGAKLQQTAAFKDGRLAFGAEDGCTYMLDAATGERLWKSQPLPTLSFRCTWPVFSDVAVVYSPIPASNVPIYYGYSRDALAVGWDSPHPKAVSKLPPKVTDTDFIRKYLDKNVDRQCVHLMDVKSGKLMSTAPAFVFRATPQPPPVITPDGDLVVAHSGHYWGESSPGFLGKVHITSTRTDIKDFLQGGLLGGDPIIAGLPADIRCQLSGSGKILWVSCASSGGYDFRTGKTFALPRGSGRITNGIVPAEGKLFNLIGGRIVCHAGREGSGK